MIPSYITIDGEYYFFFGNCLGDSFVFGYQSFDKEKRKHMFAGYSFDEAHKNLYEGLIRKGFIKISLEEERKKRNNAQNRLYWKWIGIIAKETGNDDEGLHAMMKKKFLSKRKLVKLGGKRSYQNIEGSTTDLSVKEFSEFINKVHLFFSELGFILPTMDDNELNSLYQYGLNEK